MPEPTHIRPYDAGDEAAVAAILRAGLAEKAVFAAQVDPPEDKDYVEHEMRLHLLSLANDPENWIVAAVDGDAAGVVRMRFLQDQHGPYATVREILVAPEHRRRGIGHALLDAAVERARGSVATRLFVKDLKTYPALRLFERRGFRDLEMVHRLDRNPSHRLLWLPTRLGKASGPPWGFGPESRSWWVDEGGRRTRR